MASTDGGNIALAPQILIYENSLLFLKGACNTGMLREAVDGYIASMATNSVVDAIVESLDYRKRVLELSTKLQLTNDPDLRTALRADEERIATLLVSIFHSKSDEETVLRLEGDSAQYFLDVVQETLDRGFMMAQEDNRMALRMIRKLSDSCDRLPSSLFIVGVNGRDEHPSFGGGFGDIYRASYGGQRVALKRMRYFIRGSDLRRIRLRFCREALVWKDLHHPHILPLLGIDRDSFPSSLCMVSPWMEHGTVMSYLKTHGYANIDKLLYEIAQGLEYLHSRNIVHGDLRGANILITQDWSACLTDFGLSTFSDATSTTSTNRGGSLYWMAPELLDPGRFGLKFARTAATDVYAFGCVCFELYTERPPFSSLPEPVALMRLLDGQRPKRPSCLPAMSDILWQHLSEFWAQSPTARPPTRLVVNNMVWSTPGPLSSRPLPEALPARSVDSKVDSKLTGPYRDKAKDLFPYSGKTDHRSEISLSLVKILRSVDSRGNAKKADESVGSTSRAWPSTQSVVQNMTRTTPRTLSSPPLPEALPAHSVGSKDTRPYRDEPEDLLTFPYYAKTYHPDKIYGFLRDVDSRGGAGKVDGSLGGTPRARPPAQSVVRNMVRTTPRTLSSPPLLETLFAHSINNKFGSVGTKNRDAADGEDAKIYRCKAKALYNYSPSPIDDPEDIAFNEGEILDIVDNDGDWWQARKADGSVGTAPSNFLRIIPTAEDYDAIRYRAKALYDYDASPDDSDEISFRKDEMLDIVNNVDDWWQVRKADGSVGTAPSNFLRLIEYHATRIQANALYSYVASPNDRNQISFGKGEILDILDKRGQWWQARKADGSIGIAPSYYLQII